MWLKLAILLLLLPLLYPILHPQSFLAFTHVSLLDEVVVHKPTSNPHYIVVQPLLHILRFPLHDHIRQNNLHLCSQLTSHITPTLSLPLLLTRHCHHIEQQSWRSSRTLCKDARSLNASTISNLLMQLSSVAILEARKTMKSCMALDDLMTPFILEIPVWEIPMLAQVKVGSESVWGLIQLNNNHDRQPFWRQPYRRIWSLIHVEQSHWDKPIR